MKQNPSDPDIQTIFQRIQQRDLDLQPEFQRGEVWARQKKQRLIDSILRDWHVPPIHVIEAADGRQEVLDGQQRLAAIRDFIENKFVVDGSVAPRNPKIAALSGKTYSQLPQEVRRKFSNYTIRVFRITEYEPGEPGELFFRLNQPTSLTAAETRNAFVGEPRDQVRALVDVATKAGVSRDTVSMSPERMAYDDVVARFCATLERDSLLVKISASDVTARYRQGNPFPHPVLERATATLEALGAAAQLLLRPVRLNKATLHTWLVFLGSHRWKRPPAAAHVADFIARFERARLAVRGSISAPGRSANVEALLDERSRTRALIIFNDRASSRVADVSSIVMRDAVTWLLWASDRQPQTSPESMPDWETLSQLVPILRTGDDENYAGLVLKTLESRRWGQQL